MQEQTKNKVPQLRFPEFKGEWEEKKLGEVGENIIGLTYSPKNVSKNGTIVLRSSNIKKDVLNLEDVVRVNSKLSHKQWVAKDDIVICTRNGSQRLIGKNIIINKIAEPMTWGAFMSVYRSEYNKYVHLLFNSNKYRKQIHRNLGARINQITTGYLNKFKFFFPKVEEQQKMADFLGTIDKRINLLSQKLTLLKQYKKGVMQKIFNQEIRFTKEDGSTYPDWEEKKLGEIGTFQDEKRIPLSKHDRIERQGSYRYYGASGIIDYVDEYIFDGEYVLLGEDGANIIDRSSRLAFYVEGKFWVNNHAHVIKAKHSNYFLAELLESLNYERYNSGSTQPKLNAKICKNIKLILPQPEEQEKIAGFLNSLDNKIELMENQLEQTKQYKKSLLQQMLI